MKEFQERVVQEKSELEARLSKLINFMSLDIFETLSQDEQLRLAMQSNAMNLYLYFLNERIRNFQ